MKCLNCNFDEGTLLKEFDSEKSLNDIQTVEIINKQKKTLKKIERLLNEQ